MAAGVTLASAQQAEKATPLRIKFASMNDRGDLQYDAHDEYDPLLAALPSPWRAERLGEVTTRRDAEREAWLVTDGKHHLVAVEHETGLELLLLGVATGLAVNALTGLAKWAWKEWRKLREHPPHPKADVSFWIEVSRATGGEAAPSIRLIPPPVSDDDITRYVHRLVLAGADR